MTPGSNNLVSRDDGAKLTDNKERKEQYHNVVAKAIFLFKRSRPCWTAPTLVELF